MIKKILLQFCAGIMLSVFCFLLAVVLLGFLNIGFEMGGDKANVFIGLFLGAPLGSVLGLSLVDRYIYGRAPRSLKALMSLMLGLFGVYCSFFLLGRLGELSIFIAPLVVTGFSLLGYIIAESLGHN